MTNYGGKSRLLAHDNEARAREAAIRLDERARIVRWLRAEAERLRGEDSPNTAAGFDDSADAIERGAHGTQTAKAGEEG
jgi:hypothetical protein